MIAGMKALVSSKMSRSYFGGIVAAATNSVGWANHDADVAQVSNDLSEYRAAIDPDLSLYDVNIQVSYRFTKSRSCFEGGGSYCI